jgi:hypothetical protein
VFYSYNEIISALVKAVNTKFLQSQNIHQDFLSQRDSAKNITIKSDGVDFYRDSGFSTSLYTYNGNIYQSYHSFKVNKPELSLYSILFSDCRHKEPRSRQQPVFCLIINTATMLFSAICTQKCSTRSEFHKNYISKNYIRVIYPIHIIHSQ